MKSAKVFSVRGIEFRIAFVNNFFTINYYQMKQEMLKAQQAYYDLVEAQSKLRQKKMTTEDALKIVEASKSTIEAIGTKEFFDRRAELIKEVLESNELAFDRRFWERKTTPEDIVSFLDAVYLYGTSAEEPHGVEKSKKQR